MKQRWIGILLALLLIFSLTACKDANNAAQPLPTAGSGGKLPEISKTETGDMNRDSSESSAVPDGKPDMIPPSDKEAAAVSVSGSGAEYPASEQAFERLRETEIVRYYLELGMVPIAGVILAIVMTLELIQMITDKNNLHDVDTWMIFKWVFKSAAAILIVSNTWNIVMGVFDAAQSVVTQAAGIIGSDASIDISSVMTDMESRLMDMDLEPLFGLWFQSLFIGITMWALYICIFIGIYGRMIEIYLVTSVDPIPMATMMGKEWGGMGQNYLRSLIALGFQA